MSLLPRRLVMAAGGLVLPLALVLAAAAALQERREFPHTEHAGLFPLCTGCHEGIETGDSATFYPEPLSCVGCHDGVEVARVEWSGPTRELWNLRFDHVEHVREVASEGDSAVACMTCHAPEGAPRMATEPLEAERCLSCHGHPAESHTEDAPCRLCHEPLAESRLPVARIASFEVPGDHQSGRFVSRLHGDLVVDAPARCTTCHTRDRCLACHVDGTREELALIPPAPAGMALPEATAHYPVPESHRSVHFEAEHGKLVEEAEALRSCGTCHTREDCASCHLSPLPAPARELRARSEVLAPGVGLLHEAPESHEVPSFLRVHGTLAASDAAACASCHTQPFCTECHSAPRTPEFHDPDYVARHSADAWGQNAECATCHNVQVFCRSCHVQQGFGAEGRLGPGFHDAEPLWLLRHGQAARQSLESCASCHRQQECLQCHSQLGSFRINPHGPDFDARRAWDRNPVICSACHLSPPFGAGGNP